MFFLRTCFFLCPKSNQPGRFFTAGKTHKFDSVNDITLDKLKLRPIIDQTGTYIYNASKAVAKYLRPLSKNKYSIDDTLTFPNLLKMQRNQMTMKMFHTTSRVYSLVFQLKKRLTI